VVELYSAGQARRQGAVSFASSGLGAHPSLTPPPPTEEEGGARVEPSSQLLRLGEWDIFCGGEGPDSAWGP
jgi:hypothetical protein